MYYLWFNETQSGPYTIAQLQEMLAAGEIDSETLYWQEGHAEWEPIGSVVSEMAKKAPVAPPFVPLDHTAVMPSFEQVIAHKKAKDEEAQPAEAAAPAQAQPEKTRWRGHPTLWKWGWHVVAGVVLVAASGVLLYFYQDYLLLDLAPIPVAFLIFLYIFLERDSTRYTVTTKRVSLETGIFNKSSRELRIQDIRSIAADMNFLGYGNIEFSSAASDDAEVIFHAVPGAASVRDLVKKLQN